ncbi:hypothetical protein QUF72_19065 [Desulfobacterales bacterium HSG2]|nr:hypothetical protein [Desulfobacterales bacterium HSG2]
MKRLVSDVLFRSSGLPNPARLLLFIRIKSKSKSKSKSKIKRFGGDLDR